jgi:hypothetical protein
MAPRFIFAAFSVALGLVIILRSPRPSNTRRQVLRLCGSVDLIFYKLDARHFAAAPDDFAPLAHKCMRHGR